MQYNFRFDLKERSETSKQEKEKRKKQIMNERKEGVNNKPLLVKGCMALMAIEHGEIFIVQRLL